MTLLINVYSCGHLCSWERENGGFSIPYYPTVRNVEGGFACCRCNKWVVHYELCLSKRRV